MNIDPRPPLKQQFANAFENRIKSVVEKTLSDKGSASGSFAITQNPVPTPKPGTSTEAMVPTPKSETDLNGKSAPGVHGRTFVHLSIRPHFDPFNGPLSESVHKVNVGCPRSGRHLAKSRFQHIKI